MTIQPQALASCLAIALTTGCRTVSEVPVQIPASHEMPRLESVHLEIAGDDQPATTRSVALTSDGHLVYFRDTRVAPLLVTVDSNGRVVSRWGRTGEGPGELHGDEFLHSGDSAIVLFESEGLIAKLFHADGELASERRNVPSGFASDLTGDSIDIWRGFRLRSQTDDRVVADRPGSLDRVCLKSGCQHTLLPADDSIVRRVQLASPRSGAWPAIAAEEGRFVVGDGFAYRLWVFADDGHLEYSFGRAVPPRMATQRERDRLDSQIVRMIRAPHGPRGTMSPGRLEDDPRRALFRDEPLPHFQAQGVAFDEHHRLWVIGTVADSTFFDVFSDSTYLGRTTEACGGRRLASALRGHWLALACEVEDGPNPVELKLFRIREP